MTIDRTRELFDRLLARLGISIGVAGLTLSVSGRPATRDPDQARSILAELLDLPRLLHDADGGLTVVCLDEFQDLLTADVALDGLVRSVIQHHGRAAAYVYAGSAPSLMRELFADRERPLFGQARPLELPPLPAAEAIEDVLAISAAHGVELDSDAVRRIVDLAAGHPQRAMLLAHHLFDLTAGGERSPDPAAECLERALAETGDVHRTVWDSLARSERAVATALAAGLPPTGGRPARPRPRRPPGARRPAARRLARAARRAAVSCGEAARLSRGRISVRGGKRGADPVQRAGGCRVLQPPTPRAWRTSGVSRRRSVPYGRRPHGPGRSRLRGCCGASCA